MEEITIHNFETERDFVKKFFLKMFKQSRSELAITHDTIEDEKKYKIILNRSYDNNTKRIIHVLVIATYDTKLCAIINERTGPQINFINFGITKIWIISNNIDKMETTTKIVLPINLITAMSNIMFNKNDDIYHDTNVANEIIFACKYNRMNVITLDLIHLGLTENDLYDSENETAYNTYDKKFADMLKDKLIKNLPIPTEEDEYLFLFFERTTRYVTIVVLTEGVMLYVIENTENILKISSIFKEFEFMIRRQVRCTSGL